MKKTDISESVRSLINEDALCLFVSHQNIAAYAIQ